jgi:CRISPR/Cas system-associated exonuclease Cas4 (RecB family)
VVEDKLVAVRVADIGNQLPNHVSPSQLSSFDRCSLAYWFSSVAGWREPAGLPQIIGTLVHDVLENFLKINSENRTREVAWNLLRDTGETVINNNKSWLKEDDLVTLKDKSAESLKGYFDLEDPTKLKVEIDDIERPVSAIFESVKLYGRLDRMTRDDVVRITDYKTSKKPAPQYLTDSLRQVMLYAAGLKKNGLNVGEVELIYLPGRDRVRRPTYKSALDRAVQHLVTTRRKMDSSLTKQTWMANPGTACKSCAFVKACPAKTTKAPIPGAPESEELLQTLNLEKRVRNKSNIENTGMEMLPFGDENT